MILPFTMAAALVAKLKRPTFFCHGALLLVGLVLFFFHLGLPGLMDPDEGRYAEIAREMLLLKDWLIPHLNLAPYLEKPPLVYWLTSLSFAAWGFTEGAARLPAALAALAGVYLAYWLGRTLWGERQGFWGAMLLATCGGYIILARLLTLDMVFTFFLNLGIGLGYVALSRERRHLWPYAYLALALAVLVKGPVALILAGLIWGLAAFLRGRQAFWALMQPKSWLLLAVVVLPWFFYVAWRFPEFPRFFLWEHHVERYLDGVSYHAEPWWYFGPVLLGLLLPWTGLAPWALSRRSDQDARDRVFLLLWAGVILVFFSLSRGKLVPYILPALLPLALLLGEGLAGLQSRAAGLGGAPGFRVSLIFWALAAWLLVALYFWPLRALRPLLDQAVLLKPYVLLSLVLLALIPTATLLVRRLEVLLVGALLFGALLPLGMERLAGQRSPKEAGLVLKERWQPGAELVGIYLYSQGLSFYSGQVFHLLEFRTELNFGNKLVPESSRILKNLEELKAFSASRPLLFFYVKNKELAWLKERLSWDFEILAQQKDCLLVTSRRK
jgi:4-amino-4-deoxy-L-arabinose transferase-like glycosyltransferase